MGVLHYVWDESRNEVFHLGKIFISVSNAKELEGEELAQYVYDKWGRDSTPWGQLKAEERVDWIDRVTSLGEFLQRSGLSLKNDTDTIWTDTKGPFVVVGTISNYDLEDIEMWLNSFYDEENL